MKAADLVPLMEALRANAPLDALVWDGATSRRVEGLVYATLADKVEAVNAFLGELDADPARVRSLCGCDWINAAITTLPEPLENAA
jgi:hypothetical protein